MTGNASQHFQCEAESYDLNSKGIPRKEEEQSLISPPPPSHSHPPDVTFVDSEKPEGYSKGLSSRPRRLLRGISQAIVDLMDIGLERISTAELFQLLQNQDRERALSPTSATPLSSQILLVDARRADEFYAGHIQGAVNHYPLRSKKSLFITPPNWQAQCRPFHKCTYCPDWAPDGFSDFTKDNYPQLIVYDAMGLRAGVLARRLITQGFTRVKVLKGCFYKWVDENRPLCYHPEQGEGEAGQVLPQHGLAAILIRKDKRTRSPWDCFHRKKKNLMTEDEAARCNQETEPIAVSPTVYKNGREMEDSEGTSTESSAYTSTAVVPVQPVAAA